MKEIKFYNSKYRNVISLILWTFILLTSYLTNLQFINVYGNYIAYTFLTIIIIYDIWIIINNRPSVVIDQYKLSFPLKKESVEWENIDKVEFSNLKDINESITVKVKQVDKNRKKVNVPRVFDDFDDSGHLDFSLYEIKLEKLKVKNEKIHKFILDLSTKTKTDRETIINEYAE